MYPLGTWFVSGICVWLPSIKEMIIIIIIIIIIIMFISQFVFDNLLLNCKSKKR